MLCMCYTKETPLHPHSQTPSPEVIKFDPIQCGCVRGFLLHACVFWCLLVIIFPKQMDPDQARQNTEF